MDPEYGRRYKELYRRHWWWRAREAVVLRALRRAVPRDLQRPWRALDIGCGAGLLFGRLVEMGAEVEGIEPDGDIAAAGADSPGSIHVRPFDASFAAEPFHLVVMLDVLEHLDDPQAALSHAATLLRPGGHMVITVPAFRWLWTRHDDLNLHVTRYTATELRRSMEEAGFGVQVLRYFFRWTVAAKLLVRAKEALLPGDPRAPEVPWGPVNGALYGLSRAEEALLGRLPVPLGTSVLAVATKKD